MTPCCNWWNPDVWGEWKPSRGWPLAYYDPYYLG